eukprot:6455413-Amphidinium_carterae.1
MSLCMFHVLNLEAYNNESAQRVTAQIVIHIKQLAQWQKCILDMKASGFDNYIFENAKRKHAVFVEKVALNYKQPELGESEKQTLSDWFANPKVTEMKTQMKSTMQEFRDQAKAVLVEKMEKHHSVLENICNGCADGKSWRQNAGDDITSMTKAAGKSLLTMEFANQLRSAFQAFMKEHHQPHKRDSEGRSYRGGIETEILLGSITLPTKSYRVARSQLACQEYGEFQPRFEMLSMDLPTEHAKYINVAAQASATMAEATLLSAMTSSKLSRNERKECIQNCLKSMDKQTETFGQNIKSLLHPPLMSACLQWLLKRQERCLQGSSAEFGCSANHVSQTDNAQVQPKQSKSCTIFATVARSIQLLL